MKAVFTYLSIFVLGILCASCGDKPVYIVESVQMRVFFREKIAQVKFNFNPEYENTLEGEQNFPGLAFVRLKKDEKQSLEITSSIDPQILQKNWPLSLRTKLPSGRSIPKPLHKSGIYDWKEKDFHYLLLDSDKLILGSLYQNEEFNILPKNLLAVQTLENGADRTATIAIFGPSKEAGGIYAVANFGISPFEVLQRDTGAESFEIELHATQPTKFISVGPFPWL